MTKAVSRNWHQHRTVTKNLPLRNEYDPLYTGESAICYLVDSGVKTDHEIFAESKFENLYSHDGSFEDKHGHGTQVASLVNSKELGISPDATIRIVDMLSEQNDVDKEGVLSALNAVLEDHSHSPEVTKVVLMPWIVERDADIDRKVTEMTENNLVVVCAAGQKGADAGLYTPAGLSSVVTVSSTDYYDRALDKDHPWTRSCNGTNFGESVDIFAPGNEITFADINSYVTTHDGPSTSASSAIVAGVCLNIISSDVSLTASDVKQKLYSTSIKDIVYFTDESKYNANNNRLVYQSNEFYKEVWNQRGRLAELTEGSGRYVIDLVVSDDIEFVDSEPYAHVPEFISLDKKKMIVDLDQDVEPGTYQFILSAKKGKQKFNRNFYIDVLDKDGNLPEGKEFYTEIDNTGNYDTTNYLEFQTGIQWMVK